MRALTVRQPWASLIVAGLKPVENRTWPVPSTLPQWYRCRLCGERRPPGWIADNGLCPRSSTSVCFGPGDGLCPFRLAIHAGARHDGNEFRRALLRATVLTGEGEPDNTMQWIRGWWANRDAIGGYGALIGAVLVTGCHHGDDCRWYERAVHDDGRRSARLEGVHHCSPWAEPDTYHWTLTDPVELDEPIPMRGRQGLWTVPDDALAEVAA